MREGLRYSFQSGVKGAETLNLNWSMRPDLICAWRMGKVNKVGPDSDKKGVDQRSSSK